MRTLLAVALVLFASALEAQIQLQQVAGGLELPVDIAHAGDTRLFVALQEGEIVVFDGTRVRETPFLDIRSLVACCGERGLLGVAFHPRYADNGWFFVYYTALNGDITIARYTVSPADPNRADPASAAIVLQIEHREHTNHNGGQLQFGPDGYLYAGTGDGGGGGDPLNNGQNRNSLLGKLLRIDVDSLPYRIPPSNPFASTAGTRPEIWAYGLRNPWRFSFDRRTGDLWIADVGQNEWEDVNLQRATSIGGENYGWRAMEGTHCFLPSTNCAQPGMVLPVIEYNHSAGGCSVTGGYRYRGPYKPLLADSYVYADFCSGTIFAAREGQDGVWRSTALLDTPFFIATFGEDFAGDLYVASRAQSGALYRFVDPTPLLRRRAVGR